jgi:hypothetical protein
MIVHGRDVTSSCTGKALNTSYRDGRSGFYFLTEDGATLTFSGMGHMQVKPHADRAIQPIDLVIFGYKGQHDKTKAVGSCDFSNPYLGPSRVTRKANTTGGRFEVTFRTDGRKPKVTRF